MSRTCFLAAMLAAAVAQGQIDCKDSYAPNEPIVITWTRGLLAPTWTVRPDTGKVAVGKTLYLWAAPGEYTIAGKAPRGQAEVTITVTGTPTPPVPPLPPVPPDPPVPPKPDPGAPTFKITPLATEIKAGESTSLIIICSEPTCTLDQGIGKLTLAKFSDGAYYLSYKVTPAATTTYRGVATNAAGKTTVSEATITVGGVVPPPDPTVPIKTVGLHVLIVEDSGARGKLPVEQYVTLMGRAPGTLKAYIEAKAAKVSGLPALAVVDEHLTPRSSDPFFAAAFARKRTSLPWIVAADEKGFIEGPLFANNAEAVAKMTATFGAVAAQPKPTGNYKPPAKVIDDTNYRDILAPPGKFTGTLPRSRHPVFAKAGSTKLRQFKEVLTVVPRAEWPARIKALDSAWAWPSDYEDFGGSTDSLCRDQQQTNYCWANAPAACLDTVRRIQGLPFVETSAASIGGPITNYSNEGGWGIDAVQYLAGTGGVASQLWPNTAITSKYNTPAATADRKNRLCIEWVDLETNNLDQLGTAVLLGYPCALGLDWWGHEIKVVRLVALAGGAYGWEIRNSWGTWNESNRYGMSGFQVLSASKSQGDAQLLRAVTDVPANEFKLAL